MEKIRYFCRSKTKKNFLMIKNTFNTFVMQRSNKVLLIYTGGTIGMGCSAKTGALEPLDFDHLINQMPEFSLVSTSIDTYQFTPPIDSSDMSPRLWTDLVNIIAKNYDNYDGFVILHGTDTMSYTASALSFMLENLTKPVVLTGSQLPIGQLRTDGKENLVTSIEIAAAHNEDGTAKVPEVCVYFNGSLLRGNRSTKQNSEGFSAFESFNYPHLGTAGINVVYHTKNILKPDFTKPMIPHTEVDPNVIVFTLFPGISKEIVLRTTINPAIRSIVMRTYGSGNAPRYPWLMDMLKEASDRGVTIVNITQCIAGAVEMNRYDTGIQLCETGVISGHDSTVESAITKLICLQGRFNDPQTIREYMSRPIAGEFTMD